MDLLCWVDARPRRSGQQLARTSSSSSSSSSGSVDAGGSHNAVRAALVLWRKRGVGHRLYRKSCSLQQGQKAALLQACSITTGEAWTAG